VSQITQIKYGCLLANFISEIKKLLEKSDKKTANSTPFEVENFGIRTHEFTTNRFLITQRVTQLHEKFEFKNQQYEKKQSDFDE
jgi:hypothetical protein